VLGVRGSFQPDDSVALYDVEGREIARGLVQLSAVDAARVCGKRDEKGESPELVHKDDLVLLTDE
jgi:glutamate 5-kinase